MAPAVRTSMGELFKMGYGQDVTGKLYTALRELGYDDKCHKFRSVNIRKCGDGKSYSKWEQMKVERACEHAVKNGKGY